MYAIIFHRNKYDLKGHKRLHKAHLAKILSSTSTDFDKNFVEY